MAKNLMDLVKGLTKKEGKEHAPAKSAKKRKQSNPSMKAHRKANTKVKKGYNFKHAEKKLGVVEQ